MKKLGFSSVTDAELRYVAERIRESLGPTFVQHLASLGIDVETTLCMTALGEQFVHARERDGLTLKEAAARLRVPQYRLRAVESGSRRMDSEILARYTEFLGIRRTVSAWARRYPDLAVPLGLSSGTRAAAGKRGRLRATPSRRRSAQLRNAAAGAPRRR